MVVATKSEMQGKSISSAEHRRDLWRQIKHNRWAYLFISPFFIIYTIFGVFPPLYGLFISFFKWDLLTPMVFVGLNNYIKIFNDNLFWLSVLNVLFFTIAEALPEISIAMVVAYLINSFIHKGRGPYLAAFFSPYVTSMVAMTVVFGSIFGGQYGLINAVVQSFGLPIILWGNDPNLMKVILIVILFWRGVGYNIVLYLVGMQSIPVELNEAAMVDGANKSQIFLKITLPLMRPMLLFTVLGATIGTFQLFAEPRLLAAGGMGGLKNTLLTPIMYIYQTGFQYFRFGYASAGAYVLFVLILGVSLFNLRLFRQRD